MNHIYLIAGLTALVVTYLAIIPLSRLAYRFDLLDKPRAHKRHAVPVPYTGGWAVFAGFWSGLLMIYYLAPEFGAEFHGYLPGIFVAHLIIFLGGVVDDLRALSAWWKLLIQVVAVSILIIAGLKIDTIYVPFVGAFPLGILAYPVTTLWVLLIVNAVNNIDGLDGLAGGLSLIASIGLLYAGLQLEVFVVVGIAAALVGTLFGFLRFNFPRATVFLGDSGSQSLGFVFAVVAIYCPIKSYTVVAMFVPLLSLGVPLLELGLTFFRRLLAGRSVVASDFGHLWHLLLRRGLSRSSTVLVFCGVALALQIFVFALFLFDRRVVFSILVLFMIAAAAWFLRMSRRGG